MGASNYLGLKSELEQARRSVAEEAPWRHGLATTAAFVVVGALPLLGYLLGPWLGIGVLQTSAALSAVALLAAGAVRAPVRQAVGLAQRSRDAGHRRRRRRGRLRDGRTGQPGSEPVVGPSTFQSAALVRLLLIHRSCETAVEPSQPYRELSRFRWPARTNRPTSRRRKHSSRARSDAESPRPSRAAVAGGQDDLEEPHGLARARHGRPGRGDHGARLCDHRAACRRDRGRRQPEPPTDRRRHRNELGAPREVLRSPGRAQVGRQETRGRGTRARPLSGRRRLWKAGRRLRALPRRLPAAGGSR